MKKEVNFVNNNKDFLILTQKIEYLKKEISRAEKLLLISYHKNLNKNLKLFIKNQLKLNKLEK